MLVPLRKLLYELDRWGAGNKAKRGLAVLGIHDGVKLTMGRVEIGLDIEPGLAQPTAAIWKATCRISSWRSRKPPNGRSGGALD